MDVTLPSYEAEMRDARAYLRRRDLSSHEDIPLYFAWQRLYAAASANLSTGFLQETREERDLRRRARLPPRRGISPPLFTSFDNTYRTSAQSSAFLRSGTSSDIAIEMMARRYRCEAEKLRLSRETLVNALDRAEGRLKRHKQRQTRPEQEVEDVVVCPQSGNLRSGRALKSKLIDAWKRTEASDRRQNACDDESDEEYSQVVSRSKARKSTANRELGKESFKNDDAKASGDFRRPSMSNPTPLSSLSSTKSETVEAAWTTDWRIPPDIDEISRSSGLSRKGATLSSIKSGKGLGGTSDLRKFDLVEGCKERKMMSDTSIESSGLTNDSFDPDALFDATPVSVCRPPTELDADAENTLGNTKVNQVRGATNSDVLAHDSLGIDSSLDNAQQTIGGNKSDAAENSLHLSNATGDMQVKIQGKKTEVTFKGEVDDDRTNNDSDRESCAVTSSIASREGKQQLVLQKIFEANENDSRQSGRGDDEQGSIEQTIQDGNDAQSTELPRKSKRVRFVHDDPSRQKHEMDSEDHRSSDHQRSDNEFESAGLCDANTLSSEVQKDFSPSDSTSENLSEQTSTPKFVLGNDRLDMTHDEDFPRERKPQKDQKKNDGRRQCSDAESSSASSRPFTAANLDVAEDHNKQAEDGKALQEHIDFSKPQRHGNSKDEKLSGADSLDVSKQIVAVAKPILKEGRSDKTKDRGNVQALGHFDTLEAHHMSDESKSECNDKEYPRVLEQTALATKSEFVQGGDCIEAKSTEARGDCQRSSKSGMDDKGINELNEGHTKASKQSTMRAKSASEVEQLEEKMSVNHLPGYNSSDQLQRSRVSRDKVGDLEHSNVSPRVATATISSLDCRSSSKKHQQKMRGDEDNEEKCNVLEQSGTVRKSGLERRHGSQDTTLRGCCRFDKPDEVVIECDDEEVAGEGESQKSAKPVNNRGGEFRSASQTSEDKDFMNDHQHSNPQKRQDRSRYYKDDGHDIARLHDAKKSDTRLERSYQRSRRPGHLASLVRQTDRDIEEGEESDENISPDLRPSHEHENAQPSRRLFRERTNGARAVREHHLRSAKRGSSASQCRKNTNFDMQSLSDSSEERSNDAHETKSRHEVNLVPKEEGRHRVISAHKSPGEVLLREQNNRDMLNSLACHDERGQHSRRHANQQEIASRSKFDSDEDFSYGSDTSDATRQHHRKFSHSSRTASTDRNYESQTHGRYVSSRSSSTHKRSSGSIDSDISRDDESLSDTDSSDQVWRFDRRQRPHKREQSQYRYLTENLAYQARSEPSFPSRSIRERCSRDCDVLESKNHISTKSKLGAQRGCYDKFRSESRTKASTQKPHKVSEGIVWPPGMEAECIARLGRDGHHPIAPPGLEHLVTEEQWGDYWTWLHWYSSWQMWYMKNGKKPRCKSNKEKQSRHPRESLDMGADRRQHNVNWWLDVSSTKRPHSRNV